MKGPGWRALDKEAWRAHPLNRIRGWLIAVLAYLAFSGPFLFALIIFAWIRDPSIILDDFSDDLPDWLAWALLIVPPIFATALFMLILRKSRWAPELCLIVVITGYVVLFLSMWFERANWFTSEHIALAIEFALDLVLLLYLFLGTRPNVVFRRRVRDAP